MKRRVKILLWTPILLFFIISSCIFLLFNTSFWKRPLVTIINSKFLDKYDLKIQVEGIEGNIFSNVEFENVVLLTKKNFSILETDHLKLSYELSTFINPTPKILGVEIEKGIFSYPKSVDTLKAIFSKQKKKSNKKNDSKKSSPQIQKTPKLWTFDFGITDFTFYYKDRPFKIPNLFGDFRLMSGDLDIAIKTARVILDDRYEDFKLSNVKISKSKSGFAIKNLHIFNYNMEALAQFNFPKDSAKTIEFNLKNINPNNYLPRYKTEFSPEDYLNIDGLYKIADTQSVDLNFAGVLRGNPVNDGQLTLNIHDKLFDIPYLTFRSDTEKISAGFRSKSAQLHKGRISIENIDLQKWNIVKTATHLTGISNFDIEGKIFNPDQIIAEIDFKDTGIDTVDINKITGKIEFADKQLKIMKDIVCKIDSTVLEITGNSDFSDRQLDLNCKVHSPDIGIFSPLLKDQEIQGKIIADVAISGDFNNPDIHGNISADSIGIPDIKFAESQIKFGLLNVAKNRFGSLVLHAEEGKTKFVKAPIPILNLDMTFEDDTTNIRLLNIKGDIFNVSAKGKIIAFRNISIDSLDMVLKNNHFHNINPITIDVIENTINIKNSHIKINDSDLKFKGEIDNGKLSYADAELTNFNLASMNDFLPEKHFIEGVCTGKFAYSTSVDSQKIDLKLGGKNLIYRKDHFNYFSAEMRLVNNRIIIPEVVLSDSTNGSLEAKGYFSCNFPMSNGEAFVDTSNEVDMRMDFSNFDLSILNTYILYHTKIKGKLIGDISLKKSVNSPNITTNLYILQPVFDKIELKTIRVNANTEEQNLNISNIYFTDEAGSYYGEGKLPIEMNLLEGKFIFDNSRQLEIDFFSEINSIPTLPKYVEEIQSFTGNMLMTLRLRGTPENVTSKGSIAITQGKLQLTDLENPIFDLTGNVAIDSNIIKINEMSGKLKKEKYSNIKTKFASIMEKIFLKKIIDPNKPNVKISGTLDLNDLKRPLFGIKLDAKDAYIRTPLGEQEGVVDARVDITGQDSLFINGDILLKNFTVRNELTSTGETFQESNPDALHTELNMKITSPGSFFISNSQLDCELEGEAWLLKSGNENFRLSGDFDVIDGSLYFYQWIFNDLSGNIMFKPDELNPTLDFQATVDLSGYIDEDESSTTQSDDDENLITIYLTGDLEKPDIQFASSNDQYDQSSILRLLTGTDDESLSDMQSNVGTMGIGIASGYLERQLERQLSTITGMSEFQVKNNSNDIRDMNLNEMSFTMGRRITTNLYMTFDRDYDKLSADATNSVGLRWRIDKKKSISGQINNNGLFEIKYRFRQHY